MRGSRLNPLLGVAAAALAALATPQAPPPGARACGGCHGGKTSPVPSLAGRPAGEIVSQMRQFRTGERPGTVMGRVAKGFTDAEIEAIAAWYSKSGHGR